MRPDVVTFWHGPLDGLRLTCLRSQVAAGHNVTVYSFDPLPGLPDGVGNAEAEAILPHSFSERLRPPQPDGSWRDWTILQFSDFFRMRLMARARRPVARRRRAVVEADRDRSGKALLRVGAPAPARQLGFVPALRMIPSCAAFEDLMEQEDLTPDWLALRHRLTFMLRQLRRRSSRLSDIRVAIYGPAALTALARRAGELQHALPKQSFYAVHAEPKLFFEPADFSGLLADPEIIGLHISPKGRGGQAPIPGSLYAWAAEQVWHVGAASSAFPSPQFDPAQRRAHDLRSPWAIRSYPKGAVP